LLKVDTLPLRAVVARPFGPVGFRREETKRNASRADNSSGHASRVFSTAGREGAHMSGGQKDKVVGKAEWQREARYGPAVSEETGASFRPG